MSKTITITLTIPDGVDVNVRAAEVDASEVEAYWDYLSDNGQKLYAAAARIELRDGPDFTLETVAHEMGAAYATAQSIHRTTGRTARRWNDDTGTEAPIRLVDTEYAWSEEHEGMRTAYRLPDGVAQELGELDGEDE